MVAPADKYIWYLSVSCADVLISHNTLRWYGLQKPASRRSCCIYQEYGSGQVHITSDELPEFMCLYTSLCSLFIGTHAAFVREAYNRDYLCSEFLSKIQFEDPVMQTVCLLLSGLFRQIDNAFIDTVLECRNLLPVFHPLTIEQIASVLADQFGFDFDGRIPTCGEWIQENGIICNKA